MSERRDGTMDFTSALEIGDLSATASPPTSTCDASGFRTIPPSTRPSFSVTVEAR